MLCPVQCLFPAGVLANTCPANNGFIRLRYGDKFSGRPHRIDNVFSNLDPAGNSGFALARDNTDIFVLIIRLLRSTHQPVDTMATASSSEILILAVGIVVATVYLFRTSIFPAPAKAPTSLIKELTANGSGNPRDFVEKMKTGVRPPTSTCGPQLTSFRKSAS